MVLPKNWHLLLKSLFWITLKGYIVVGDKFKMLVTDSLQWKVINIRILSPISLLWMRLNLQIFQILCIFPCRIRMKLLSSIVFVNFSIYINLFDLVETKFEIFKFSVLIQDRILKTSDLIATQVKSYQQRILDIQGGHG